MTTKLSKAIAIFMSLFFIVHVAAQNPKFAGSYMDRSLDPYGTSLQLNNDGTFFLSMYDPVFPLTFQQYTNKGNWISRGDTVILNPDKIRRTPTVTISNERISNLNDSVEIEINFIVETYQCEQKIKTEEYHSGPVTVFLFDKKKKKVYNLVREKKRVRCLLAPPVRNLYVIDSTNIIRLPFNKKNLTKIGVYSYGFTIPVELEIPDPMTNRVKVNISLPVDEERTPRSKKVLIKKNSAYFYEYMGKINKTATPLKKSADI